MYRKHYTPRVCKPLGSKMELWQSKPWTEGAWFNDLRGAQSSLDDLNEVQVAVWHDVHNTKAREWKPAQGIGYFEWWWGQRHSFLVDSSRGVCNLHKVNAGQPVQEDKGTSTDPEDLSDNGWTISGARGTWMVNGRYIEPYENYSVENEQGPGNWEFLVKQWKGTVFW